MNPTQIAEFSYIAATIGVIATLLLAKKRQIGWAFSITSTVMYMVYGAAVGITSQVIVEGISLMTSMYAWDNWLTHKQKAAFVDTVAKELNVPAHLPWHKKETLIKRQLKANQANKRSTRGSKSNSKKSRPASSKKGPVKSNSQRAFAGKKRTSPRGR